MEVATLLVVLILMALTASCVLVRQRLVVALIPVLARGERRRFNGGRRRVTR
jgi:hypothetical protein